ncbi:MAG: SIMPL domain-containing protein [Candidatus Korobacteraceae bacterium]
MRLRSWQFIAFSLLAFTAMLFTVAPLGAQDRSSAAPIPNTVWVGADGKYEAEPDTVLVQFSISAQEEKLQDANQKASRAADHVRQLLRSNGLDPKDAQVGQFSVQPVYDYKNSKRKLVGYRVDTNISIKLKDFSKVGPITQGLSDLEDVTGNQSLSYLLDDMEAAKIKAVEDALARARGEANSVARFSGRTLGELSYASVDTYEPSPVRPMAFAQARVAGAMAAPPPPPPPTAEFGAQKITVTAHVNALYMLK